METDELLKGFFLFLMGMVFMGLIFGISGAFGSIDKIECNLEEGGDSCRLYNLGTFTTQQYVELIELSNYNGNMIIREMDKCVSEISGRNDTFWLCNEVLYNVNRSEELLNSSEVRNGR